MQEQHRRFWNKEYSNPEHLSLSDEPAEDLEKFMRWVGRNAEWPIEKGELAIDLGCGNGRNLIYLAKEFALSGFGYDISEVAVKQAERKGAGLPLSFMTRSIDLPIPKEDGAAAIVLDMMTSHYLPLAKRLALRDEIVRVLRPGGFLFFKSFLLEGDLHAKRLLVDRPGKEPGTYIHHRIGVPEHVWTEEEVYAFFQPHLEVRKFLKSHKHVAHGRAFRRRTFSVYCEKM